METVKSVLLVYSLVYITLIVVSSAYYSYIMTASAKSTHFYNKQCGSNNSQYAMSSLGGNTAI